MEINVKSSDTEVEAVKTSGKNNLITYVFLAVMAVLGLLFGILGLVKAPVSFEDGMKNKFEKGSVVEGYAEYGTNTFLIDYSHAINKITLAHEYYFLILDESRTSAVLVRAPKRFGNKFDESMEANELVRIKGKVRKLKTDVRNELTKQISKYSSSGTYVESDVYVDLLSTKLNILAIILGVGNLAILICVLLSQKKMKVGDEMVKAHKGTGFIAVLLFMLCGFILLRLVLLLL